MSGPGGVVASERALDVERVRRDFPALDQQIHGHPLVYLDNAATTHKPSRVLDAVRAHDASTNANVHRGVHTLSQRATEAFENARERVAEHIGAGAPREIVFTRGTTEAINLVAHAWGRRNLAEDDEVLVTEMEHHSNIVPWQLACEATGANLRVAPITDDGALDMDALADLVDERTALVAVTHISNALGTINPVDEIVQIAHEAGALCLIDGAQAVAHAPVDVTALDADFYAFSGHKVYGPTGIGALYGKAEHLEAMPPYQGGGEMIRKVRFEQTTYADLPAKFEAGTPNITGAVGLGEALAYVDDLGIESIAAHETALLEHATELLEDIDGLRIVGRAPEKTSVISFTIDGVHPHDVGTLLDREGVAIRAGHHCAQPTMDRFGLPATSRASFALYNTHEEAERLAQAIETCKEVFA